MFDQLFGLLLVGLGIQTPVIPTGSVLGDETETVQKVSSSTETVKPTEALPNNKKRDASTQPVEPRIPVQQRNAKLKETVQNKQQDLKNQKQELKTQVEERRDAAKKQSQEQREAFKSRLELIKDERKKKIIENLDSGMARVNTVRTDAMSKQLTRMEEILNKASSRLERITSNGTNATSAISAVSAAEAAISAAQAAVTTQAGRVYIIGITTESDLSQMAEKTRTQLQTELSSTQALVKTAAELVAKAIQEVAKLPGAGGLRGTTNLEGDK